MIKLFIIATIIFLFSLWLGSVLINFLLIYFENKIRNSKRSEKARSSLFEGTLFFLTIISTYFCCFLVTALTSYFFAYQNKQKVFIGCIIPVILGVSMILSTRKYASKVSDKEFRAFKDAGVKIDPYTYEFQKLKDNFFGVGIISSLILFIIYSLLFFSI